MIFEKGHLYHIYNQGNNRQKIFFEQDNYLFFLQKVRIHLLPYCTILAWCLMPNHFHLMVLVNEVELGDRVTAGGDLIRGSGGDLIRGATQSRTPNCTPTPNSTPSPNSTPTPNITPNTFNKEIGILLASYTRAINKQENKSGSLFRQKTKAECLSKTKGIAPSFYNTNEGALLHLEDAEKQYPQLCFNYIHQNPVKANLVHKATDWEFSSAKDYAGLRKGNLVNQNLAKQYITYS